MRLYAGIGSRETPEDILDLFRNYGSKLADLGWILRSGGADGADTAFEEGALKAGGSMEIWLPWDNFNGRSHSQTCILTGGVEYSPAEALAEKFHPKWSALKQSGRALMARNSCQVLGRNLDTPVEFVLCWTPKNRLGGTGQAIRIAKHYNIPVYNLGIKNWNLEDILKKHQ